MMQELSLLIAFNNNNNNYNNNNNNSNNNNNNNGLFTVFQQKRGSYNCKCYLHY